MSSSAAFRGRCWCFRVEIPAALLARVPEAWRNRACICRQCVEDFHSEARRATPVRAEAFTLVELLVAIAVVGLLAALLLPGLGRAKATAAGARCASNLRQLGLAARMYWDDHGDLCFRYRGAFTNSGDLYWFGWLARGAEGHRAFDASQGALYPYLRGRGVEICPALSYSLAQFKPKARGASFGYGYNLNLSSPAPQPSVCISRVARPSELALFADAAQVNDFQAPASRERPMLEEWYYVDNTTNYPNGHFRHAQRAYVGFCDGHADRERLVPGSLDQRLPAQFVGRLRPEILAW